MFTQTRSVLITPGWVLVRTEVTPCGSPSGMVWMESLQLLTTVIGRSWKSKFPSVSESVRVRGLEVVSNPAGPSTQISWVPEYSGESE